MSNQHFPRLGGAPQGNTHSNTYGYGMRCDLRVARVRRISPTSLTFFIEKVLLRFAKIFVKLQYFAIEGEPQHFDVS